ncbi:adenylyltransferase/cytidyltransferase family protein [Galactobacter caseinivorans]|uniref:Cytidyltransferase n=1 Tax=Galactobacter caseinivorans TaxID=2676123 RepID=A0A496PJG7_9MICC|nr:adenylyltransferase/cytidyltransferase family protein [Galactobacter caseinivorans]RKW70651.1 cytidyltransferase [Galactobacter caseinivorans]
MRGLLQGAGGRERQGTVGYAAGAFDLFHVGHLNILKHSADRCDHLVAGVVSDAVLLETKGIVPVIPEEERVQIVAAMGCVDAVYVERQVDRLLTWDDVRFDVFFKGDDWRGTPKGLDLERRLGQQGVRVEYFPYTASTSSTRLRSALDLIESSARVPLGTSA